MLQEYSFEVVSKPSSTNAHADALSYWDELLSGEGILEPVIMLSNVHCIIIDIKFAAKIHIKTKNE